MLTSDDAFNQCRIQTEKIQRSLKRKKIPSTVLVLSRYIGPELPDANLFWQSIRLPLNWAHCVVHVKGIFYDPTWRQFEPGGAAPKIWTVEEMRRSWSSITSWNGPMPRCLREA